jgi:hypothetical protein
MPCADEPEEMPLPSDPKVIFLGGLFALALLAAIYVAAEIVLPLVLAVVLKLLSQPAMRLLERWHVPRMLAASRACAGFPHRGVINPRMSADGTMPSAAGGN